MEVVHLFELLDQILDLFPLHLGSLRNLQLVFGRDVAGLELLLCHCRTDFVLSVKGFLLVVVAPEHLLKGVLLLELVLNAS